MNSYPVKLFFFVILLLCSNIKGQIDYSFSGYITDFPIYQKTSENLASILNLKENQFYNLTRLRLRPEIYLWENAKLAAEIETSMLYSSYTGIFNPGSTDLKNRQIIDLNWDVTKNDRFTISSFIDRLYYKHGFSFGEITIGRQRISWGTGRIWNPTDLFNPINPANYYKIEKDGVDAVSGKIFLGNFTDLNLVFNPGSKIKDSNYGLRFRTNFYEYDISLITGLFDKRKVIGLDFAGNFFDAGLRGEGIISYEETNTTAKFVLGADYQFSSKIYALFEYQYNGMGQTDKYNYEIEKLIRGEILNLNRHYLYFSIIYQYHPLLSLMIANNHNIVDGSGFLGAAANYSLSDNTSLNLGTQITYGNDFTEYWYFPVSLYAQLEIYF